MKLIKESQDMKVSEISVSPHHFRDTTVDERLAQLADSIKKVGQVHAVSVVKRNGKHELINGHRRWKAAKHGGLDTLRTDIYEFEGDERNDPAKQQRAIAQFLLAANMSEPLIPLERAHYWDEAIRNMGLSMDDLADIHSVSVDDIREDLKYLNLSDNVVKLVQNAPDKFTQAHLKILAEYSNPGEKKAWRLTEQEQEKLALRLLRQEDKREVDDPRAFEKTVKGEVAERRRAARDAKKREKRERTQGGALLDFLKVVDRLDKSIKDVAGFDFTAITGVSKVDKHRMMTRLLELSELVAAVATERIAKLPEEKKKASKEADEPVTV